MEIGISVTSAHPRDVDARTAANWVVERAAAVAAAGFASFSIGDHHATPAHYVQNVPMLGRCLAELGSMPVIPLFLLPLWHPLLLAEQVGTLAAIAQGPLHCILAVGRDDEQFPALGVSARERRGRMEEAIPLLRRLFSEDHIDHAGEFWQFENVSINPKPPQIPEFWIGANVGVAIDRAARVADGWLASPGETPEQLTEKMAHFGEALSSNDRASEISTFPVRRDVYIGESDAEAAAATGPLLDGGYRGIDPSSLIVGGPETAVAALQDLEARGFNHTLIRFLPVGQDKILKSIARIGSDVIPELRTTGG
jgi:alkanesulfonate monooxygenase SsuD/methylene tetrahydromethanopterin reductase-like flavin-dependent oxidoreductase (luciferase family)